MIIYEVNLAVDDDIDEEFEQWLHDHVHRMLEFEGFGTAEILRQRPEDMTEAEPGKQYWTILYRIRDRSALDNYLTENALRMRQEGQSRFPGKFTASRRTLYPA